MGMVREGDIHLQGDPGGLQKDDRMKNNIKYSKSPRIRTYFFESQAEIGSYFKVTKIHFKV